MSKLKAGVWMRFLECFADCLSLRKCAQRCGVCLKTAFLMRQRVIECIRRYTPVLRSEAGSCVRLDETYFRESFKGNHTCVLSSCYRPVWREFSFRKSGRF